MRQDAVNPSDLAILIRVADAGSVTRAAEELYLSQPAVTQHLRKLERALGATLVERRGRGLGLTDAGRTILPLARQALQVLGEIPAAISEVHGLLRGHVVLGASTTVGEFVLPKRLSAFAHLYPHITVSLQIANTQAIVDRVLDHSLQAGVVGLHPVSASLLTLPFGEDEVVLVAAPAHPLAGRRASPDQLAQTRLLVREAGSATRAVALEALARCGVDTRAAIDFGSNAAVRTAVLSGYGVGTLSRQAVADDLKWGRLALVRLQGWRCRRRFYIIRRRDRKLSQGEAALLNFLAGRDK